MKNVKDGDRNERRAIVGGGGGGGGPNVIIQKGIQWNKYYYILLYLVCKQQLVILNRSLNKLTSLINLILKY